MADFEVDNILPLLLFEGGSGRLVGNTSSASDGSHHHPFAGSSLIGSLQEASCCMPDKIGLQGSSGPSMPLLMVGLRFCQARLAESAAGITSHETDKQFLDARVTFRS